MRQIRRSLLALGMLGGVWTLVVRGALTLDVGLGRRTRPLGPLTFRIDAPRELVFDVVSAPYLQRTPRALKTKLEVLERSGEMVLAAHHTKVRGFVATTVETVRFEPPSVVHFRLVRGPVPHVVEQFLLHERGGGTELEYRGELGTDFWSAGAWWGERVGRRWEAAVRMSLEAITLEAERRAAPK
jgi:hypothetical protein